MVDEKKRESEPCVLGDNVQSLENSSMLKANLEEKPIIVPKILDKSFWRSIPIASSYLAIVALFSSLFGFLTTYSYLDFIVRKSLFQELLGEATHLFAISFSFFLMSVFFYSTYFISSFNIDVTRRIYNNHGLNGRYLLLNFLLILLSFSYLFAIYIDSDFYILFFFLIFPIILSFLCIKSSSKQAKEIDLLSVCVLLILSFIQHLLFIYIVFPISDFIETGFIQWLFFWYIPISNITFIACAYLIIFADSKNQKKHNNLNKIIYFFPLLFFVGYMIIFSEKGKLPYQSLYIIRFIEKPQDSSWYLIHNGNTTSETINGMTKDDIKYRQQSFIPNGWQQYCKDDVLDRMNMRHCPTLKNDNALYGYMAWNLGKTKVFCPQSVDFFKTDDKKQRNAMSQACMQIDGGLLQPVSQDYL